MSLPRSIETSKWVNFVSKYSNSKFKIGRENESDIGNLLFQVSSRGNYILKYKPSSDCLDEM